MKTSSLFTAAALAIGLLPTLFTGCTDPIDVGSDLLDEDRATVGFTDTLDINAITVIGDSVRTYTSNLSTQLTTYLFGRMEEPLFGTTEASIYMTPLLQRSQTTGLYVDFNYSEESILDSIVLVLPIDSTGIYGQINSLFPIDVFEIEEDFDFESDGIEYFSNISFQTKPMPLVSDVFRPTFDTTFVTDVLLESLVDTATYAPHVRISLPMEFGQMLLDQDTSVYQTDSTFRELFKGLHLKPGGPSGGLINFDLFNKPWGGIYLYYREQSDTLEYVFPITALSGRISRYEHDYSGSLAGGFIESSEKGDSLLFLQGLQGLLVKLDIPNIDELQGKIVNQAELELNVATVDGYDLIVDPPAPQIIALKRNADGELVVIEDVAVLPNDLDLYFGGQPVETEAGTYQYRINLSVYLQYIIDGSEPETIYLALLPRSGNAGRVIFNGDETGERPARLKVSFTDF